MEEKQVYTSKDIQNILSVSRNTVYALLKDPPFSVIKIGDTYRVSKEVFEKWLHNRDRQ